MAFIAAVTNKVELVSGVLILPQRQTGVVAKQAAQVDILSGGRVRLGVGWNHVEYEAPNEDWKTRGARQAEQIEGMRKLWTEPRVTFRGRFHTLIDVTMLPAPAQRPIPIWFGGSSDAAIKPAARIGDGYMPIMSPEVAEPKIALLFEHMKAFGRDSAKFGLEGWLRFDEANPDKWLAAARGWKRLGAKVVMLCPMYRMALFDDQSETLRRFKEVAAAPSNLKFQVKPVLFVTAGGNADLHHIETCELVTSLGGFDVLLKRLERPALDDEVIDEIRSVIEGAKALKRPRKSIIERASQQRPAVALAKLEAEIANFERRAANCREPACFWRRTVSSRSLRKTGRAEIYCDWV